MRITMLILALMWSSFSSTPGSAQNDRKRARELGIEVGVLPTGRHNAITDVDGVRVGHQTIIRGTSVRTGVTVVVPHSGNLYREKLPAAVYSGNAFGKLAGSTQVNELGNIETPIALTNTLSVPRCMQAIIRYTLDRDGNEQVRSVNAIVGETNDGYLNDIRGMHVQESDVLAAIAAAEGGAVAEGCVGAGVGTVCFGFKGGIGTSSRVLPRQQGGHTVGVLVQTNFGGMLSINGAPVGRELAARPASGEDGSCMIIVATDAPLSSRNLQRLAKRSMFGLARTGSAMSNGSGDYAIAFSTGYRLSNSAKSHTMTILANSQMNPLFRAVVEASEEAIYNSLLKAETTRGRNEHQIDALPIPETIEILNRYQVLNMGQRLRAGD